MPERPVVKVFSHHGMTVERDSLSNLVIAQTKNMYTGVMHLKTKVMYFAALAKPEHDKDDHYGTHTPKHLDAFPCRVLGETIVPIIHKDPKNPITSHEQLVQFVLGRLNNGSTAEDFCGFALRFEDGKKVALSPTSRTLNPGGNGQLEQVIMDALETFLSARLRLLGFTLEQSQARVTPDAAQQQRGGAVIPKNLFGSLQGLKKVH